MSGDKIQPDVQALAESVFEKHDGGDTVGYMVAAIMADRASSRTKARAYYLAAEWRDTQAKGCEEMSKDEPRFTADIRGKAAANAVHHRASAAGLRLAATGLLRSVVQKDGA